jgi:shikimate dehydrogenase
MPHKNLVASLVKTDSLKSVNTLVRGPSGWIGHSTDGDGFLLGLQRAHVSIDDFDSVIILGSGGAAQSILRSIALATAERPLMTIIHRRSKVHDQNLRDAISVAPVQILTLRSMDEASFFDTMRESQGLRRLIIQATSAPKHGNTLGGYISALDFMTTEDLMVDLIYDQPSELYRVATQRGLPTQDGLPMLIEQARLSQKLWWGESVSYEDLERAIKEA